MKADLWVALGLVVALLLSHWFAYQHGRASVEAEDAATVQAMDAKLRALRAELDAAQTRREIVYRDRVRVIRDQTDDCMRRALPAAAIGQLRADDPLPP